MNNTDINQASELHELCKKVYELTEWECDGEYVYHHNGLVNVVQGKPAGDYWENNWWFPIYTSDYLLEKLPKELENHFLVVEICNAHNELEWTADYYNHRYSTYLVSDEPSKADTTHGETPLKSLLRLTIALSEAGELK